MQKIAVGEVLRGKMIKEVIQLSDGRYVIKTEDGKSKDDFRVKLIWQTAPRVRSITPKHAHFVIDLYGKLQANKEAAMLVFRSIADVWSGQDAAQVLSANQIRVSSLPGYSLEYILYALKWILDQEDINYWGRPDKKQLEIDEALRKAGVTPLPSRLGSQLAMSLFCNVAMGQHPVEAFLRANLDVIPVKRARGAV